MNRFLLPAALAVALTCAGPALAKRGNAELKRYCSGDAATFCGDVDPASKAMNACFQAHRKELSPNCRRAIDAYQARGGR
jgi:hypothetical protein